MSSSSGVPYARTGAMRGSASSAGPLTTARQPRRGCPVRTGGEAGVDDHTVRSLRAEFPVEAQRFAGSAQRVCDAAAQQDRTYLVQPELELRDDPEVAAASAESPEEVWMLL